MIFLLLWLFIFKEVSHHRAFSHECINRLHSMHPESSYFIFEQKNFLTQWAECRPHLQICFKTGISCDYCIPSFAMTIDWCVAINFDIPVIYPQSGSTWSYSLKDKCHFTISASSCAIRLYVVSLFEEQVLPHDFGLFVCHQTVRDLAL
jgi:hypothetical protein